MTVERPIEPSRGPAHPERWQAFCDAARAAGMDPESKWVGGYVDYEWTHLRPLLEAYRIDVAGRRVLEFGCNVGASCVVLARMGAQVTGVDVDPAHVAIAEANIALDEAGVAASAQHVPDTRDMPFADGAFDIAIANSVLEYVDPELLAGVLGEIHRVIAPGGYLFVCGTASRIAPREIHSRRWLVNYLPQGVDRLVGRSFQRGLSPWRLARATTGRFEPVQREGWLTAREALQGRKRPVARAVSALARSLGIAPGWFSPNIELLLKQV